MPQGGLVTAIQTHHLHQALLGHVVVLGNELVPGAVEITFRTVGVFLDHLDCPRAEVFKVRNTHQVDFADGFERLETVLVKNGWELVHDHCIPFSGLAQVLHVLVRIAEVERAPLGTI